jgi:hypothetical protein
MKCSNAECHIILPAKIWGEHIVNCQYAIIKCKGDCGLSLTKKDYFNTDDPEKIDQIGALHCCETALKTRLE